MNHIPLLVAFTGPAGSGKSSLSDYLKSKYQFEKTSFAKPLKDMLKAFGLNDEQLYGKEKEVPCELLKGKTPRFAMQTLGTEWGRNIIADDIWIHLFKMKAKECIENNQSLVVEDCRFLNEAKAVKDMNGIIIRVDRHIQKQNDISSHLSETEQKNIIGNYVIDNTGPIEQTWYRLDNLMKLWV